MIRRKRRVSRTFAEIAIVLALAIGVLVGALSQQPTPTPSKPGQNPQNLSNQQRQDASDANPNTTTTSAGPVGQVNTANRTGNPDEKRDPKDDSATGPWSAINSGLMVLANLVVAAFTCLLYRITRRQALLFANQNKIMGRQSTIMNGQLVATEQSASAANDAVLFTHRPRLKVRAMVVNIRTVNTSPNGTFIIATNVGTTTARLIKMYVQWIVAARLPMENPMHSSFDRTTQPQDISAGGFVKLSLPDFPLSDNDVYDISAGTRTLFVFGYLKYTDQKHILRRTYFCRRYDLELGRFVKEKNPDYNYTD
jgi:hypothetical protein